MQLPAHTPETPIRALLQRGQLFLEKCEFPLARATFLEAFETAKLADDREGVTEAIAALLRLAAEAQDDEAILRWDSELEAALPGASAYATALAWHNRSVVATLGKKYRLAQTFLYRALRAFRAGHALESLSPPETRLYMKIWGAISATLMDRELSRRSMFTGDALIRKFANSPHHAELASFYINKGVGFERARQYETARSWYQKAHASILAARHWYFHLYILYAYARIERHLRNFPQAYWYLDLIAHAANGPDFGNLESIVATERARLADDAVDLLIDSRQCEVRTREKKDLTLGKQYVLLGILEALTDAHHRNAADAERGLSKGEIIERVWNEKYRPEAHDNKLYYNINRLRKLIEPDMRHPKYLLNWKEGYRLAPGLKVHFIGGSAQSKKGDV